MADVTLTINSDKTITLSTQSLGSQGERVSVDVVVPAAVAALGYEAYIDFLLPDGASYYKGGYDCSSSSFTFGLGATDSIMDKDGVVGVQFWVGTIVSNVKTVHWATAIKKSKVNQSIGATSAAILPYLPQMVVPASYPAANISLEDAANRFTAAHVEAALAELAGAGRTTETVKSNATAIANMLNLCWPVGSIYIGVGSTSPATLFGGTWSVFGAGKVMIGIDSTDVDFDTVEETGGAKTHVHGLSAAAAAMVLGSNEILYKAAVVDTWTSTDKETLTCTPSSAAFGYTAGVDIVGDADAASSLPPYVVVRMWKRTA